MDIIQSIDRRLARIEERSKDIPQLADKLDKIDEKLTQLRIKVATVSALVAFAASAIFELVKKL